MADDDLKCEMLELKKHLRLISTESMLLKVKIRKLQSEIYKKNKQMETLLDPQKSTSIRKIITERGATMIINLKNRNNELEEILLNKDAHIKKLQLELQTSKVYLSRGISPAPVKFENMNKHIHIPLRSNREQDFESMDRNRYNRSRSLSITPTSKQSFFQSDSDTQLEHARLSENLQKIKLANCAKSYKSLSPRSSKIYINNNEDFDAKSSVSVASDKSSKYNSQEFEIHIINMVNEMEKMKETISNLSAEQATTKKLLKVKNINIELLAKQVKKLLRTKYGRPPAKSVSRNSVLAKSEHKSEKTTNNDKPVAICYSQESFEEDSLENSVKNKTNLSGKDSETSISEELISEASLNDDDDVETGD